MEPTNETRQKLGERAVRYMRQANEAKRKELGPSWDYSVFGFLDALRDVGIPVQVDYDDQKMYTGVTIAGKLFPVEGAGKEA